MRTKSEDAWFFGAVAVVVGALVFAMATDATQDVAEIQRLEAERSQFQIEYEQLKRQNAMLEARLQEEFKKLQDLND